MVQSFRATLTSRSRGLLETAAFHQPHGGIDNGFRRQAAGNSQFEPEDIARQKKRADLAPSIGKQFVGPNRAADDLIDIFRRLVLAVDLLIFAVGELGRNEARMTREQARTDRSESGNCGLTLLPITEVLSDWVCMCHLLCGGWPMSTRDGRGWKFRSIS